MSDERTDWGPDSEERTRVMGAEPTARLDPANPLQAVEDPAVAAERREADAAARQAQREDRERRLGAVISTEEDVVLPPPPKPHNDKTPGSIAFFLLRLSVALVTGVRGLQYLLDHPGTTDLLDGFGLPSPGIWAWVLGIALMVSSLLLLFGFLTRFAAAVIACYGIAVLVFIRWGLFNIFLEGSEGFAGDFELLLVASCLLLTILGSGGWAIDAGLRANRARRKTYNL